MAVGSGLKFLSPGSNRINLKYDPYWLNELWIVHPGIVASIIYFFQFPKRLLDHLI